MSLIENADIFVYSKVNSYRRSVEELREEMQEYQVELDQLKAGQADPLSKGNSLFSEVEDRRHLVESQMTTLKSKYENLKVKWHCIIDPSCRPNVTVGSAHFSSYISSVRMSVRPYVI